ncbi:MAG: RNA 3'-terminal phosphate cyclase [Myxococcota bacterium]|nr:RNA 3'-terminal phosphate cyclase [Myxococcota bacterium]
MLVIDGSSGEGGGQILRSALALAMVTRRPFRIERIRAGRDKPGLLRQHLVAVRAAGTICNAEVVGDQLGSTALSFRPRAIRGGEHRFVIEGAGSTTLVLQTIAPALLRAAEPSVVTIEGGTHNPAAPPFDFLARCWAPAMAQMGVSIELSLERPGFAPKGGGALVARVTPGELARFEREERGRERARRAVAITAGLPDAIADRELRAARARLGLSRDQLQQQVFDASLGPGNVFFVELEHEHGASMFASFGQRAARAEHVAEMAISRALAFSESDGAIEEHLADQLLLPMAIGKGGVFTTTEPTSHAQSQAELLRRFLDVDVDVTTSDERTYRVALRGADL